MIQKASYTEVEIIKVSVERNYVVYCQLLGDKVLQGVIEIKLCFLLNKSCRDFIGISGVVAYKPSASFQVPQEYRCCLRFAEYLFYCVHGKSCYHSLQFAFGYIVQKALALCRSILLQEQLKKDVCIEEYHLIFFHSLCCSSTESSFR